MSRGKMATAKELPEDVARALHEVLNYLWDGELKDYRNSESGKPHIFEDIVTLDNYLKGTTTKPSWYL